MGNANGWVDMGDAALKWLCPLVYGVGRGIYHGAATGDWWGASDKWADAVCPLAIGSTYAATENAIRGNWAEAVKHTQKALFPGADPVTESITEGMGQLGKWGTQAAIDADIANKMLINSLLAQQNKTKEEEKKQDVEEEEQKNIVEKEEARDITNQQANTARKAAYQAAINSGATPAQAQAAADAQTPIGNFAGNYAALAGAGANARADYRERQGYADALGRETLNLAEARNREIAAAALQGIGSGTQTGINIFGNSVGGGN